MWKKLDLTTAETCCFMESSASKVTPSVFTTLENGMDASPTERQSTGTISLLDDGPQRSTSVFCSLSLFVFRHPYFYLSTARLNISQRTPQTQVQLVCTSIVRNRRQKSDSLCRTYQ